MGCNMASIFIVMPTSENGPYKSDMDVEGFRYYHVLAFLRRKRISIREKGIKRIKEREEKNN